MRGDLSPLARPHGKHRGPPRPWKSILFLVLFLALLGTGIAARVQLALVAPHVVSPPNATLTAEKRKEMDDDLDIERPLDRDQAIDYALDYTARSLSLSPGHATPSFDFGVGKHAAGSPEYAAFFVSAFEAACKRAGSSARAWRVRSAVRIFGKVVPLKLFADHDWILVYDAADGARIFLDPMLNDAFLSANLSRNVKGGAEIAIPSPASPAPSPPPASAAPAPAPPLASAPHAK
jgi:hypothetical protein